MYLTALAQIPLNRTSSKYWVEGICVDTTDMSRAGPAGIRSIPKANIFAIIEQQRRKVGTCNAEGEFRILLPANSTQIIFEAKGYKTLSMSVNLVNYIPHRSRFILSALILCPINSPKNYSNKEMQLVKCFDVVDSIVVHHILENVVNRKRMEFFYTIPSFKRPPSYIYFNTGVYQSTLSTESYSLIFKERIELKMGINLMYLKIDKPINNAVHVADILDNHSASPKSNLTSIYFEQSKYEVRAKERLKLDSLSNLLKEHRSSRATITGYSDNVGKLELNITLSEYRAKTILNYLKVRGIQDHQLIVGWKGPETKDSLQDSDRIRAQSHRVDILIEFNN